MRKTMWAFIIGTVFTVINYASAQGTITFNFDDNYPNLAENGFPFYFNSGSVLVQGNQGSWDMIVNGGDNAITPLVDNDTELQFSLADLNSVEPFGALTDIGSQAGTDISVNGGSDFNLSFTGIGDLAGVTDVTVVPEPSTTNLFFWAGLVLLLTRTPFGKIPFRLLSWLVGGLSVLWVSLRWLSGSSVRFKDAVKIRPAVLDMLVILRTRMEKNNFGQRGMTVK